MERSTLESLVKEIGIPFALLDQRCSDEHLHSISLFLDWRMVAPYLGLSDTDIEDIEYDRRTELEKRRKTLWKWKSKYGYAATFKNLVQALLKVENTVHAERVCRLLKPQEHMLQPQVHTYRLGSGGATASATSSDQPLASPWQQQHRDKPPIGHTQPVAPQATTNWELQTLSRNAPDIVRAITHTGFTHYLADELKAQAMIGRAVYAQATNYGPNITEDMRAEYLIDAVLSKIEHDPQRYYDFIKVLKMDSVCADAESALALLPTDPPQGSEHSTDKLAATTNTVAAQKPVHPFPPSSSTTGAGATEDTLEEGDLFEIECYLLSLEKTQIYNLGLALGLHQRKVKGLMDSPTFLDDVVLAWLRREDSVEKRGVPSWRTLVKALSHRLLGQSGIADDIARDKGYI